MNNFSQYFQMLVSLTLLRTMLLTRSIVQTERENKRMTESIINERH